MNFHAVCLVFEKATMLMYEEPPTTCELPIDDFEDLAVERYQLYRIMERAERRGFHAYSKPWENFLRDSVKDERLYTYYFFLGIQGGLCETDARRNDHIAHFILRLANCKSVEARARFTEREIQLFRLKYAFLNQQEKNEFCKNHNPITWMEKFVIDNELEECTPDVDVNTCAFYEIPFYEALESVSKRSVYMRKGKVYLPANRMNEHFAHIYRKKLKTKLLEMCQCLDALEKDERVKAILDNADTVAMKKQITIDSTTKNTLHLDDLDGYAKNNFPMCMEHLHEELCKQHHLKHQARVQYGRFLKDAGFNCEQVVQIFRDNFCKKIDENKFAKKYLYGIRYMFGETGRKREQSGYCCSKIIDGTVACNEEHGCPFKHWDDNKLRDALLRKKIASPDIEDIVSSTHKGEHQKACTKYFNCTHCEPYSNTVEHPNEYFEESKVKGRVLETLKERIRELEEAEEP